MYSQQCLAWFNYSRVHSPFCQELCALTRECVSNHTEESFLVFSSCLLGFSCRLCWRSWALFIGHPLHLIYRDPLPSFACLVFSPIQYTLYDSILRLVRNGRTQAAARFERSVHISSAHPYIRPPLFFFSPLQFFWLFCFWSPCDAGAHRQTGETGLS